MRYQSLEKSKVDLPLPWPYPTKIDSQNRFLGSA